MQRLICQWCCMWWQRSKGEDLFKMSSCDPTSSVAYVHSLWWGKPWSRADLLIHQGKVINTVCHLLKMWGFVGIWPLTENWVKMQTGSKSQEVWAERSHSQGVKHSCSGEAPAGFSEVCTMLSLPWYTCSSSSTECFTTSSSFRTYYSFIQWA